MLRTGSLGLDILLGGGWKAGTINEIWGPPGSGKTTLAEHAIWELPPGQNALWVSMGTEVPHRPSGAAFAQPKYAEQAFYIMNLVAGCGTELIVVDSANGLVRKAELEGDPNYTPHPQREYREELNRLKETCQASGTIVLFLSKPRDRDRQPIRGTGISEKAKDRVHLDVVHQHQDETRDIRAFAKSNQEHAAFRIEPGSGIDWADELFRLGVRYNRINNNGTWYAFKGTSKLIVQGVKQGAGLLRERADLAVHLDEEIRTLAEI